jgi:hypothetical protein
VTMGPPPPFSCLAGCSAAGKKERVNADYGSRDVHPQLNAHDHAARANWRPAPLPSAEGVVVAVVEIGALANRIEVDGLSHTRPADEVARVCPEFQLIDEPAARAAEQDVIDCIEPNEAGKQSPVAFGDDATMQISLGRQTTLQVVHGVEYIIHRHRQPTGRDPDPVCWSPADRMLPRGTVRKDGCGADARWSLP